MQVWSRPIQPPVSSSCHSPFEGFLHYHRHRGKHLLQDMRATERPVPGARNNREAARTGTVDLGPGVEQSLPPRNPLLCPGSQLGQKQVWTVSLFSPLQLCLQTFSFSFTVSSSSSSFSFFLLPASPSYLSCSSSFSFFLFLLPYLFPAPSSSSSYSSFPLFHFLLFILPFPLLLPSQTSNSEPYTPRQVL